MEGKLTRIGPVSYGKIMAICMALFGFVYALFMMIFMSVFASLGLNTSEFGPLIGLGWGMVIAAPIFYGIIGFLMGLISAALYNLFAKLVGGIEVKIE